LKPVFFNKLNIYGINHIKEGGMEVFTKFLQIPAYFLIYIAYTGSSALLSKGSFSSGGARDGGIKLEIDKRKII